MKILYVTSQMYLHGGIEKILTQKINHWIKHYGYEVLLCTSEQRNHDFVYKVDAKLQHIDLGINYHRKHSYFHPINILKSIVHFKALKELINKEQPDIVISVNYTPEQYFLPFMAKHIPKVKEFHSSGVSMIKPKSIIDKLKNRLFLVLGRYQAQVVLNEDEKKYYTFNSLYVIPNFIEINEISETPAREKTILAAGRIASVKQFDHLIQAWSYIAYDFPDWEVKIFGDGDATLSAKLEQLIEELKVPNIQLMGSTSHLNQEMQKAAVYAMTSATECFPMVLLEAQANKLAIISYDCPNGPRNIITHNLDGWLTAHNEINIFAEKLSILLNNEIKRESMGTSAKKNSIQFSKDKIMKKWNELFIKLQAKKL